MELPFPAMELSNRGWYKVFGVVTNRSIAADELIWWSRQRCGKGEEVHSVLKSDLAGGRLPSGLFGGQRRMVGHIGAGPQPELCHEAAGVGRTVGGQASEGGALRPDRPTGPCDASRQEVDHPSGPWPSLIRVAAQGAAEDIGAGCRAVSSIATLLGASVCRRLCRVARPGHAFFGLRTAIIGSEPLPIPSKTAPETLSDARSCHASPLVDTRTPPESTPSSSQPCQVGNLGHLVPLTLPSRILLRYPSASRAEMILWTDLSVMPSSEAISLAVICPCCALNASTAPWLVTKVNSTRPAFLLPSPLNREAHV